MCFGIRSLLAIEQGVRDCYYDERCLMLKEELTNYI